MTWQQDFHKAMVTYVAAHGLPRKPDDNGFQWVDYSPEADARAAHFKGCPPDPLHSQYTQDAEWREFEGTFAHPPYSSHYGLDALITCKCGLYRRIPWRLEASLGEVIAAVVKS